MQANRKASALRTVISDRLYTIVLSDVKFAIVFCTNLCKTVIVIVYFAKSLGIVLVIFAVAPFAGAWIEMAIAAKLIEDGRVAPFTGAWIEIAYPAADRVPCRRRSLHGSVD